MKTFDDISLFEKIIVIFILVVGTISAFVIAYALAKGTGILLSIIILILLEILIVLKAINQKLERQIK